MPWKKQSLLRRVPRFQRSPEKSERGGLATIVGRAIRGAPKEQKRTKIPSGHVVLPLVLRSVTVPLEFPQSMGVL
ncbi:DUF2017 domain-containing protein [Sesbania bispinosa]|nr:DUF2017 domain-containing protein [Sesbania bispinosa]